MILKVYTDWGSRWNPWNSWIWVCIMDENEKIVEKRYKNLGVKTNNEAEYLWAYYWVKRAIELWGKQIYLYMDSSLVINQLSGKWKIKKEELWEINRKISTLIKENKISVEFEWVRREQNKEADRLSNVAMDEKK